MQAVAEAQEARESEARLRHAVEAEHVDRQVRAQAERLKRMQDEEDQRLALKIAGEQFDIAMPETPDFIAKEYRSISPTPKMPSMSPIADSPMSQRLKEGTALPLSTRPRTAPDESDPQRQSAALTIDALSSTQQIVEQTMKPMLDMMSRLAERMDGIDKRPTSRSAADNLPVIQTAAAHPGDGDDGDDESADSSVESISGFTLTSSQPDRTRSSQQTTGQPNLDSPGGDGSGEPCLATISGAHRKKELDEVKGIPQWPTTAQFASWKRDNRYAVCGASATPQEALVFVHNAENYKGELLAMPTQSRWETLAMKWGKALRHIVKGEQKRELAVLEEKVNRTHRTLLSGPMIYCWICRKFEREAQAARPQVLKELQMTKIGTGRAALSTWKTSWDIVIEKLVQSGGQKEGDEDILYTYFKESFMQAPELADHISKVKRSSPSSKTHTYAWMYKTVTSVLETQRLETQESDLGKMIHL